MTRRILRIAVPTTLVAATLVACTTSSGPPPPPTVRVERTSVTTSVSSSGSLTAVTQQNLGFLKGGQLKTVDVKVGQKVTAGQVLATVDDTQLRHTLEQQQGQLASQQAALNRIVNATTVTGAENTTNQAGRSSTPPRTRPRPPWTPTTWPSSAPRSSSTSTRTPATTSTTRLDQAEKACGASGGTPSSSSIDTSGLLSGSWAVRLRRRR